ncbi:MAG: YcgN family cysteine cluster protein [Arenicella sp.]
MTEHSEPFWKTKTLAQMDTDEWESLCDGCGQCCLVQLENEEQGKLFFTDVACHLLDQGTCRCTSYDDRATKVSTCMVMDKDNVAFCAEFAPPTCAYRLLVEGKDLYDWHPLVSGDPETVHQRGVSVQNKVVSANDVDESDLEDHIIEWPEHSGDL